MDILTFLSLSCTREFSRASESLIGAPHTSPPPTSHTFRVYVHTHARALERLYIYIYKDGQKRVNQTDVRDNR